MRKITKRDVLFFFAGMLLMLAVEVIYDWSDFKQGFMNGWNRGNSKVLQEQTK